MKSILISIVTLCTIIFSFNSCNGYKNSIEIPEEFKSYIKTASDIIDYKEIIPFHGEEIEKIPLFITKNEAIEDIQMMEYLLSTSYSGFDYWKSKGVDFASYFTNLRDFAGRNDTINVETFENELSKILTGITDGHIAIDGLRYNWAYKHKDIYFCDILVEKTNDGLFKVIDTKFNNIKIGDLFSQKDGQKFLFKTLSPKDKNHYLIGTLSYHNIFSRQLSFNNKIITIPFHKTRLMYAKFDDSKPFYIERENDIPIVRVFSFSNNDYSYMKEFVNAGIALKSEKQIILNLSYNGGGSSVFPQDFIKNLNDISIWELSWAYLTSPAIIQYFATYDLNSKAARSPVFRNTIIMNSKKLQEYLKAPMKNWEFGRHYRSQSYGSYKGTLIILTNRGVLSAGESTIGYSKSVKNRIVIGENTGGVAQFSDVQNYYLPNSKIRIILPRQIFLIPDFEECVGFLPDLWLDSRNPVNEIINWLDDPESYQFKFECSYDEMLDKNNLAPILPAAAKIITPSLKLQKTIRSFSGKWFGITQGVLDQLLVVESINDNMEVNAIYSWGVAYQWGINQPGWERYSGTFKNQKLLLSNKENTVKITCLLNYDSTLDLTYKRSGIAITYTTLKRIED